MNFFELMVKWGTLIWPAFVLASNLILSLILRYFGTNPMKYQAAIALEQFFSCNEAIIVDQNLQIKNQDMGASTETQNEHADENPVEKAVVFVNTETSNEYYSMNKKIVQFLFASYYNTFVIYFGYFCIQTFFLKEKISAVCLDNYICEPVRKNYTCLSMSNSTNEENFLCSQYEMGSFDSFLVNLAVVKTVLTLLVETNMSIFRLIRFILRQNELQQWCTSQRWIIILIVTTLGLIFIFWLGMPFVIFRFDSLLLTRSLTSKIVSIVATSTVVVFMAIMINMVHDGKKLTCMLYMEVKKEKNSKESFEK
jgi:hypothetical protein